MISTISAGTSRPSSPPGTQWTSSWRATCGSRPLRSMSSTAVPAPRAPSSLGPGPKNPNPDPVSGSLGSSRRTSLKPTATTSFGSS
eukprot:13081766-Alexandrium_andersonii.AAC.1